jgi:hypothetical protein
MELEEIKHKLTPAQYDFFYAFKEYIELPIYFIGSILRYDYFKGYSDLDINIFSPDINSTNLKIKHFLNIEKKDKIIFININKYPISGYKFYYNNSFEDEKKVEFDLSIFKENTKKILLETRFTYSEIPFFVLVYFLIIKTLHYHIGIINNEYYTYLKKLIWAFINKDLNPQIMNYDEYTDIYKKIYPNTKYMVNI